jgi:hypothetical protein
VTDNQAEFRGWAKVEVMGHQSHIGHVTTEAYGQAVMFRVDRPEIPEREVMLEEPDWINTGQRAPAGSIVKKPRIPAVTVLIGAASIYRIIPCSEAAALKAIESSERRPLILIKLSESAQIQGPSPDDDDDPDDDDGPDDDQDEDGKL